MNKPELTIYPMSRFNMDRASIGITRGQRLDRDRFMKFVGTVRSTKMVQFDVGTRTNLLFKEHIHPVKELFEKAGFTVQVYVPTGRDIAGGEERWAIEGLELVAKKDPDRASKLNHEGFSGADSEIGHSLVEQYVKRQRLSDRQWALVLKLAHKYRKQIKQLVMERVLKPAE